MGFHYTGPRNVPSGPAAFAASGFGPSGSARRVVSRRVLQSHERHNR